MRKFTDFNYVIIRQRKFIMNQEQCMLDLYKKCCSDLPAFEIWKGYYNLRYEEFKKFYLLFPKKNFSDTLEIGCGIGYQAGFLSCVSNKVTASDVDFGDMIQHSRGLSIAENFIKHTGLQNIEVVNANAESLPFADEQFDFIYCSYSFQYIVNKDKALQEIRRVLKKEGHFFCVLPTTMYRIKAAFRYYINGVKKMFRIISTEFNKSAVEKTSHNVVMATSSRHTRLLPPPDDDNNSYLSELYLYSTVRWKRLFSKNQYQLKLMRYTSFDNYKNDAGFLTSLKERLISDGIILVTEK
jgi:ubiquinone/menaquinone biosynthesis C-methylase UbiE